MAKTKKLTREGIINWATNRGWILDKHGHLHKEANGKRYRLKLSSIAVRHEVQVHHLGNEYTSPSFEWVRLSSGYYKGLTIDVDGKLAGMRGRKK